MLLHRLCMSVVWLSAVCMITSCLIRYTTVVKAIKKISWLINAILKLSWIYVLAPQYTVCSISVFCSIIIFCSELIHFFPGFIIMLSLHSSCSDQMFWLLLDRLPVSSSDWWCTVNNCYGLLTPERDHSRRLPSSSWSIWLELDNWWNNIAENPWKK